MLRLLQSPSASISTVNRQHFSDILNSWLAVNCWTSSDFALLTRAFCFPSRDLSARVIDSILTGSRFELMPIHFQAFAAVELGLRQRETGVIQLRSDVDLLCGYTTSLCRDDSAAKASWCFALYCGETWALQMIDQDLVSQPSSLSPLIKRFPGYMRSEFARNGLDPVSHVKQAAQVLNGSSSLKASRYIDWALDYCTLTEKEARLAFPFSLMLLSSIGHTCDSLHQARLRLEPDVRRPALAA